MVLLKKFVFFICFGLQMIFNDKCFKYFDSIFMMFILYVYNIEIIVLGDNYLCIIYKINIVYSICYFIRLYIFFVILII